MTEPKVTLIVSPRERFSCSRQSLESIYEQTQIPFKLIYLDGNSPPDVKQYLEEKAQDKGFTLLRFNHFLSPNQARNLGLEHVDTPYVVFVDNDVIVSPGWLEALIQCAEETGAAVVGPLMCHHEPVHEFVHFAGGESHVFVDVLGRRRLREKMYLQGHRVANVRSRLKRTETELCEFHCMLARTAVFEETGPLDEMMLNTKEHVDFCMEIRQRGKAVYFEPDSVVTYVPGPPRNLADLHYYMLRWSNDWELTSLNRLRQKWNLAEDIYFKHKYKALGWRRRNSILFPLIRQATLGLSQKNRFFEKVLMYGLVAPIERQLNRYLTWRHARRQGLPQQVSSLESSIKSETATIS
ncbi:glycosyltransferase [Pseudanabaena sp. FACHB-2040]|uniref:glycosyltransferase family 2 protein n=1 Tax=Pseudanabaena sp. FACHB-2040 TaxID=2692859 RepID=UPI00168257AE|nr:glycosyltransferase [Pseudanabaena sp. FACHB-2040]MBD2256132.1 glycosyltransferase [Pseudanabaena sp. FACHB-2040]